MNAQMAYLLGMILGNGEIQRDLHTTTISIEIPHKNLQDDSGIDVLVYVKASLSDIRSVIEPLIGREITVTQNKRATRLTFTKENSDYLIREIMRFVNNGSHHTTMVMNRELFDISLNEKKELLRGVADVTGYIRRSNVAFGQAGMHRVYIEVPGNWQLLIDLANMFKAVDVPVQTLDFGHPNFRDSNLKKYNEGHPDYWKKEHQLKIFANEFLTVGFNIINKQKVLEELAAELLRFATPEQTHKYYWEKPFRKSKSKPRHPGENDPSLPPQIRGKHYDSWTDLAFDLGYHA